MKRLSTLFIASLLATGAWAQADQTPASVPGAAPAEVKPAETAFKPRQSNPFTGTSVTVEELQAELETARLRTAALEEQLKQTNLSQEISTVPLRKAVEAAQARASARAEMTKLEDLERAASAAREAEAAAKRESEAARKAARQSTKPKSKNNSSSSNEEQPVVAAPPPPPSAIVMSIMSFGTSRSAVLDFGGNTLVVEQGGMTPLGQVNIVDENTVQMGGRSYKVSTATLSRYTRSEGSSTSTGNTAGAGLPSVTPMPQTPGAPAVVTGVRPSMPTGMPPGTSPAGIPSGTPGIPASLPPLQLPPGVSLLPASR